MPEYDVMHIIFSFNSTDAGWDNVPAFLGKHCIDSYITPLTYIPHQYMIKGGSQDMLKTARVTSLYKSVEN